MPVCFIGSNHTRGGNWAVRQLMPKGNLIGLNFDRVWEGTMSDLNYDPSICRNIMVDARYILFVIDKFAGAGHLVNEMKLVHPKGKRNKTIKYTTSVHELRFEKLSPSMFVEGDNFLYQNDFSNPE